MKKLNRKGFTLIELLAVIVVLAIIIVVTIPSVIDSMNNAKSKQLENAVGTVTEWFTKQYELGTLSDVSGGPSAEYKTFIGTLTDGKLPTSLPSDYNIKADVNGKAVLKAAGITNPEGLTGKIYVNNNKVCIILKANQNLVVGKDAENNDVTETSQFYDTRGTGAKNEFSGSGC